jgi:hypothetical protein
MTEGADSFYRSLTSLGGVAGSFCSDIRLLSDLKSVINFDA